MYPINMSLTFHYDGDDTTVNYTYYVQEILQDITEYLFEEEYGMPYLYSSWFLEEGAREFVKNIETLWTTNNLDAASLYTNDGKFISWLTNKYEEHAKIQFFDEHSMENYYGKEENEEELMSMFKDEEDII